MKLIIDGNGLASRARFGSGHATRYFHRAYSVVQLTCSLRSSVVDVQGACRCATGIRQSIWDAGHSEYRTNLCFRVIRFVNRVSPEDGRARRD
jgi:hypothetical protein